jgi:AbrB family looped-hinge helix DNA binding protein
LVDSYRVLKLENQAVVKNKSETIAEGRGEVIVKNKGQVTIPAKVRKKYNINEGTRLEMVETEEGIILKPKKSIWDMIGAFSDLASVEEMSENWYKLRHEKDVDDE